MIRASSIDGKSRREPTSPYGLIISQHFSQPSSPQPGLIGLVQQREREVNLHFETGVACLPCAQRFDTALWSHSYYSKRRPEPKPEALKRQLTDLHRQVAPTDFEWLVGTAPPSLGHTRAKRLSSISQRRAYPYKDVAMMG